MNATAIRARRMRVIADAHQIQLPRQPARTRRQHQYKPMVTNGFSTQCEHCWGWIDDARHF